MTEIAVYSHVFDCDGSINTDESCKLKIKSMLFDIKVYIRVQKYQNWYVESDPQQNGVKNGRNRTDKERGQANGQIKSSSGETAVLDHKWRSAHHHRGRIVGTWAENLYWARIRTTHVKQQRKQYTGEEKLSPFCRTTHIKLHLTIFRLLSA